MDKALLHAPIGADGEKVLRLSQTEGLVYRLAKMRLMHDDDYRIVFKGEKVRVVA